MGRGKEKYIITRYLRMLNIEDDISEMMTIFTNTNLFDLENLHWFLGFFLRIADFADLNKSV